MNLLLFGFKGAGKTYFGKRLALSMGRPFIDTDDLILNLYLEETGKKKKLPEIYKELGEEGFRAFEKKTLPFLARIENSIIALGGGTVLDPDNVRFLQTIGILVFLQASFEKVGQRMFRKELPSFLDPEKPEESFARMIREREPIYRSIPARSVDTDALDEAGVLAALRSILLLENHE